MLSTPPATAQRFKPAPDDSTAVVDTMFVTAGPARAVKVLCRAIDESDAEFVAQACSSHGPLLAALRGIACTAATTAEDGDGELAVAILRTIARVARTALAAARA